MLLSALINLISKVKEKKKLVLIYAFRRQQTVNYLNSYGYLNFVLNVLSSEFGVAIVRKDLPSLLVSRTRIRPTPKDWISGACMKKKKKGRAQAI